MNLYAESSAVLAWLLREQRGPRVRQELSSASSVVTSDLTIIECDRALLRARALGELNDVTLAARQAQLAEASGEWDTLRIAPDVVERARRSFPGGPVWSLDAIHLASLLLVRSAVPNLRLLSLDDRVRRAAFDIGIPVVPEHSQE